MLMPIIGRFAPSPTGLLHLGNAYSALLAHQSARRQNGRFLLRIEDIDQQRCRPEYEKQMIADLAWLGLDWDGPIRRQSDHLADYAQVVENLSARELVYPCFCSRKDLAHLSAPHGPLGAIYPGTCRKMAISERRDKLISGQDYCWRLDLSRALEQISRPVTWKDRLHGDMEADWSGIGDPILARKDTPTSYHLAVTYDDGLQLVSEVVRGEDLLPSTPIHCLLQQLLGLSTPIYQHHPLVKDADGQRLAKRNQATTLKGLREAGVSPLDLRRQLGLS